MYLIVIFTYKHFMHASNIILIIMTMIMKMIIIIIIMIIK